MGGAAGHMAHPFDLPRVKNGDDLFEFFEDFEAPPIKKPSITPISLKK